MPQLSDKGEAQAANWFTSEWRVRTHVTCLASIYATAVLVINLLMNSNLAPCRKKNNIMMP